MLEPDSEPRSTVSVLITAVDNSHLLVLWCFDQDKQAVCQAQLF